MEVCGGRGTQGVKLGERGQKWARARRSGGLERGTSGFVTDAGASLAWALESGGYLPAAAGGQRTLGLLTRSATRVPPTEVCRGASVCSSPEGPLTQTRTGAPCHPYQGGGSPHHVKDQRGACPACPPPACPPPAAS